MLSHFGFSLRRSFPHPVEKGWLRPQADSAMEFNARTILDELKEVTKWHALGIQLEVPPSTLSIIEQNFPRDTERCKSEMVIAWLQRDSDASWEKLAQALSTVGYRVLSEKLSQRGE